MKPLLRQDGIQSILFSGHDQLPFSVALWLRFDDLPSARCSLRSLTADLVLFGLPDHARTQAVQVMVSSAGIRALREDTNSVVELGREFQQGITAPHRRRVLGDCLANDPSNWSWSDAHCHALIITYGATEEISASLNGDVEARMSQGCTVLHELVIYHFDREHFGFRDGISNPHIPITHEQAADPNQDFLPPGEMLMGYPDGSGANPPAPPIGLNGSYAVVRQFAQNVEEFWDFWRDQAANDEEAIWLASKAVGRWPNGMPITSSQAEPQPTYDPSIAFRPLTFENDFEGDACPPGAHIRRANPRDGLSTDPEESRAIANLHRMIRRGRVFWNPLPRTLFSSGSPFHQSAGENRT